MTSLLVLKEQVRGIYSRYENIICPIGKFMIAFIVFQIINQRLGFDPRLTDLPVVCILSLISAVLPVGAITVLSGILAVAQVFAVSKIIAAVIVAIYIIMYCLSVRYTANMVNAVLAIPILYVLNIPYVVPILLGMIGSPIAILPTTCGVVTCYLFGAVRKTATSAAGTGVEESLGLYKSLVDVILANNEMVFFIVLFAAALLVTYVIRKSDWDYAFEAANAAGAIVCTLGVLVGKLMFDISGNTIVLLIGGVVSGVIVFVIWHLRLLLDYSSTEHLQFEDDDYYYYVKAVPKIKITTPEKNVKRINPKKRVAESEVNDEDIDMI